MPFSLSKLGNSEIFVIFHGFSLPSLFQSFKLLEWFIINLETFSACRELNFIVFRHKNYSNPIIFTWEINKRIIQQKYFTGTQNTLKQSDLKHINTLSLWFPELWFRSFDCIVKLRNPQQSEYISSSNKVQVVYFVLLQGWILNRCLLHVPTIQA